MKSPGWGGGIVQVSIRLAAQSSTEMVLVAGLPIERRSAAVWRREVVSLEAMMIRSVTPMIGGGRVVLV